MTKVVIAPASVSTANSTFFNGVANALAQMRQLVPANALAVGAGLVDGEALGHPEGIDWRLPNPIGLEFWLRAFFGSRAGAD